MSDDIEIKEELTPACTEIHEWIDAAIGRKETDTDVNRASEASNCVRKRWYKAQGFNGEPMSPRSMLTFATGDVVEHVLKYFIEKGCVGPGKLYSEVDFGEKTGSFTIQRKEFSTYEQETLDIDIGGLKISGHPDGWGKRNSDGAWELIEIKSSANYMYQRFLDNETPDYIRQVHAYMLSSKAIKLGVTSTRFFYMRKETGHIYDRLYLFNSNIAEQVIREFRQAVAPEAPEAPYDLKPEMTGRKPNQRPTGRLIAGYPCSYCPYVHQCKPGLKLEFKSGKPVLYLDERKAI